MIICSSSNIDIVQGVLGYGNPEGITDWRIANTVTGSFDIINSISQTSRLTILENGNVGIGNTNPGSILDIGSDVNITGIYKKGNRDIISDTSNYAATTSNILVPRILTEVGHGSNYISRLNITLNTRVEDTSNYLVASRGSLANTGVTVNSQWANTATGINYTHITIPSSANTITSSPVATTTGTTGSAGDYTFMSFTYTTETAGTGTGQTQYTLNVPTGGVVCDILIVGGGGSGGIKAAGGGGAGGLIFRQNETLNGTYTIKVGKGGNAINVNNTGGLNGSSSSLGNIVALGGGGGGAYQDGGKQAGSGGSGGGSFVPANVGYDTDANSYGNNGGVGKFNYNAVGGGTVPETSMYWAAGGGGGAGSKGQDAGGGTGNENRSLSYAGDGGIGFAELNGIDFKTHFNLPTNNSIGQYVSAENKVYFAGGGGGGNDVGDATAQAKIPLGGKGGGGNGINNNVTNNSINALANSGGGGGSWGSGGGAANQISGSGGSGIVIIRYLSTFKNIGIGTAYPNSRLHVYDNTTNNTIVTVQNNYVDDLVVTPNTVGYTAVEALESNKYYRTLTFNYFPNYPEDPPNTSLLAWYRLNGDGLDYNPSSTTKYNLIANVGTPTYSSGTTADSFLQGRRYINTGAGSLRTTTLSLASRAFSVALWMRTKNSASFSSIGPLSSIINQGNASSNTSIFLGYLANNAYYLAFIGNDLACGTGVSGSPTSYASDLNTWVHIVYVVLPNYNRRIYRNGVLIATDSNTTLSNPSGDLRVGADYNNNNLSLNTDISDLRIYNNGLSATEVATLYASYTNLVITDNYAINFKKSTTLLVNNVSKTVNGAYTVSMGHINSSMLPAGGQTETPLVSTAITSLPIKYEYTNTSVSLPALITVSGATSSIIGTTERAISFTYTSDSAGLTGQTQYSFTATEDLWCDILVVGGGGGGGHGGGGGGGVLLGTNLKINGGSSVSVKVGNGGTGTAGGSLATSVNGVNGFNSSITMNFVEYIAVGGGGGGTRDNNGSCPARSGNSGGSGGGGSHGNNAPYGLGGISNKNNYTNFQSFGNNGGLGRPGTSGAEPNHTSGGGGGAGSAGNDISYTTGGGNGGQGKDFISYFGTNVGHNGYFGGGGGGQTAFYDGNRGYGNGGLGLYGGGGDSAKEYTPILLAHNGLSNTGGGGGGGRFQGTGQGIAYTERGGNGGSGFVIIRYRKNRAQAAALELIRYSGSLPTELVISTTGTTSTTIGSTDRCVSFPYTSDTSGLTGQTQYTFTTPEVLTCDILVIGGGGGGGRRHGGGGGAGTLIYHKNITLNGTYTIRVGKGGQGCQSSGAVTANTIGYSSQFIKSDNSQEYLATGGGNGGAGTIQASTTNGGGTHTVNSSLTLNTTNKINGQVVSVVNKQYVNSLISPEGCRGNMGGIMTTSWKGGGGGGAGSAGMDHSEEATVLDGYGGLGLTVDITGIPVVYAGGGSGSDYFTSISQVFDPSYPTIQSRGGGGFGSDNGTPQNGLDGTGGGGGGNGFDNVNGGNGGSGIVIIRYRKANTNYKIGNYGGDLKIISSTLTGDNDYIRITKGGSSIYNPTGSPLWSTTSDRRIKENIEKASYDMCYDNISRLDLYRFNYIKELNNINKDLRQLGYIAQEVQGIFPKAVSADNFYNDNLSIPDLLTIDITQINYSLYGAVKKLMEMYNEKRERLKKIKYLLNIDSGSEVSTSNLVVDTSNLVMDTSNIVLDTSNIVLDTSNLVMDTSNLVMDTSNLVMDTSNVILSI
jgi:hypothetical protein